MFAVIKSGGLQYRVTPGQVLKIGRIAGEERDIVELDQVLMLGDGENVTIGQPVVAGAKVRVSIVSQGRDKKIFILKFKRRKHHMKRAGHRQDHTFVKVESIDAK